MGGTLFLVYTYLIQCKKCSWGTQPSSEYSVDSKSLYFIEWDIHPPDSRPASRKEVSKQKKKDDIVWFLSRSFLLLFFKWTLGTSSLTSRLRCNKVGKRRGRTPMVVVVEGLVPGVDSGGSPTRTETCTPQL